MSFAEGTKFVVQEDNYDSMHTIQRVIPVQVTVGHPIHVTLCGSTTAVDTSLMRPGTSRMRWTRMETETLTLLKKSGLPQDAQDVVDHVTSLETELFK